ncbi:MAG: TetR/AcrR family transcriptional regulator [Schleiferiaceae bacterium]|nr:TetR/AcrR family transcriptional regulator [Schleiferiaceae bacterium]
MTEKQQQILSSAQKLFALEGVAAVSTARIAKEAGVSEALIFRHFKNKKQLVEAVVKAGLAAKSSMINRALHSPDPMSLVHGLLSIPADVTDNYDQFFPWVAHLRAVRESGVEIASDSFVRERLVWAVLEIGHGRPEAVAYTIERVLDQSVELGFIGQEDEANSLSLGLRELLINE